MNKRVLLIGGNGFIGSHLVDELLLKNYTVRVLDRFPERFRAPLPDVEYVEADYSDIGVIKRAVAGCDAVLHLAHVGTPATSAGQADQEVLTSITAFVRLLEWLKGGMVDRFVFFSSGGAVYGRPDSLPVREDFKGWPVSPYGVAKLSMEHYLHMFALLNDLQYQIIRPSNPYGPRQNYLGAQGVIPIFMYRMLTGIPIEVWGDGSSRKDYIFVRDLARAAAALLESNRVNETFNVGAGTGVSLNELIRLIENACGKQGAVSYRPQQSQDVSEIILSCEKMKSIAGWSPEIGLEPGLARTYEWMKTVLG
jgi:UDP-glucose 4-epimerase